MKKESGFSIILPTYNAAEELKLMIKSILGNSRLDNQLIVIVDALKGGGVSEDVLRALEEFKIQPVINKRNLGPYRSWNKGAKLASKDWLCFVTDDQYFAPKWDKALWDFKKRQRILTSQLVEPGVIPVWQTNIEKDFGRNPKEFKEKEFLKFVHRESKKRVVNNGFFIPLLLHKDDFKKIGGFSCEGEFGTRNAPANDIAFIKKAKKEGFEFKRALNSFSYHFQGSSWRRKNIARGISAAIISRPNESKIRQCLDSVKEWVDEIIIVIDSKEKGNVAREAKGAGAQIFYRQFDGYSAQKNFAISKARGQWILSLDADEVVSSKLAKELKKASKDLSYNGYYLPRENIIFGKKIRNAGWYPDYQLRFFVKEYGEFSGIIHERINVRGGVGYLKNPLVHYNYDSIESFIDRLNRYTTLEARQLTDEDYKLKQEDFITRPIQEFLRRFFSLKGYRDGLHGLALSLLMAFYTLVIYLKIWQKEGFKRKSISSVSAKKLVNQSKKEANYWWYTFLLEKEKSKLKNICLRVKKKFFCNK
mgnify:CR=1 FL=1